MEAAPREGAVGAARRTPTHGRDRSSRPSHDAAPPPFSHLLDPFWYFPFFALPPPSIRGVRFRSPHWSDATSMKGRRKDADERAAVEGEVSPDARRKRPTGAKTARRRMRSFASQDTADRPKIPAGWTVVHSSASTGPSTCLRLLPRREGIKRVVCGACHSFRSPLRHSLPFPPSWNASCASGGRPPFPVCHPTAVWERARQPSKKTTRGEGTPAWSGRRFVF